MAKPLFETRQEFREFRRDHPFQIMTADGKRMRPAHSVVVRLRLPAYVRLGIQSYPLKKLRLATAKESSKYYLL